MKIATRFETAMDFSQMSLKELTSAVESNITLRSRLVAMANTAHTARARRISKVSEALMLLGTECVTNCLEIVSLQ